MVNGLRKLRIGAIGARPAAFNTVRYSEKILEANGITIEPIDLSEIFGRIERLKGEDADVQAKAQDIRRYVPTDGIPDDALMKMAKLGVVIDGWMKDNDLDISAVQCWTSMEEYFGVVPCTVMSMMCNDLHVERLRSGRAAAWSACTRCASPPKRPAPCSTGTTTTETIPTRPSASTAATCPSISSRTCAWTTRRSSPAPSAS